MADKTRKFTFGLSRLVAGFDIPEEYEHYRREDQLTLLDLFNRAVGETGFFEKTKFDSLDISINAVNPMEWQEYEIDYLELRAKNMLSVGIALYENELLPQLAKNYFQFHVQVISEVLMNICEKYGLDKQPIEKIIETYGRLNKNGLPSKSTDTSCSEHEMHVHIKTSEAFPSAAEFISDTDFLNRVDGLLKVSGTGSVTGSECGGNFETLFCEGLDVNAMYAAIRPILSTLPKQSFVELFSNGRKRRIDV